MKINRIKFSPPIFADRVMPKGMLVNHMACHALFYYYLLAMKAKEQFEETIVYEDEVQKEPNYKQIMASVATVYGEAPETMIKFWSAVDLQCHAEHLPTAPNTDKFRMNKTYEIRSH